MSLIPETSSQPEVCSAGRPRTGLNYAVARTMQEVLEAWHLVYKSYRADDLIDVNPFEIHTTPQAVGPNTAVVTACIGPLAVGTISGYADGPLGLPLDSVYRTELEQLRHSGRKLMEVGLFADRREHLNRAAEGLFELMRFAYFFGIHSNIDDFVIGVHPRHAAFYMRLIAFEKIGQVKTYPTVKDHAVVLLRLKLDERMEGNKLPKGLAYFYDNPVPASAFANRFLFDRECVTASPLAGFLANHKEWAPAA
jgi:hypothetical protein